MPLMRTDERLDGGFVDLERCFYARVRLRREMLRRKHREGSGLIESDGNIQIVNRGGKYL